MNRNENRFINRLIQFFKSNRRTNTSVHKTHTHTLTSMTTNRIFFVLFFVCVCVFFFTDLSYDHFFSIYCLSMVIYLLNAYWVLYTVILSRRVCVCVYSGMFYYSWFLLLLGSIFSFLDSNTHTHTHRYILLCYSLQIWKQKRKKIPSNCYT